MNVKKHAAYALFLVLPGGAPRVPTFDSISKRDLAAARAIGKGCQAFALQISVAVDPPRLILNYGEYPNTFIMKALEKAARKRG